MEGRMNYEAEWANRAKFAGAPIDLPRRDAVGRLHRLDTTYPKPRQFMQVIDLMVPAPGLEPGTY